MDIRIGHGWDSHAFQAGVPLRIGGIAIDHPEGLAGHRAPAQNKPLWFSEYDAVNLTSHWTM